MDFIEYLNIMMKTGLKSTSLSTDSNMQLNFELGPCYDRMPTMSENWVTPL